MNNIDINFKNSKFYIVEVRVDNYNEGEHSFYTSDQVFTFLSEAENCKNNLFANEVNNCFSDNEVVLPDDLSNYNRYTLNPTFINDGHFDVNKSWVDSENLYVSARIKELILDTNL